MLANTIRSMITSIFSFPFLFKGEKEQELDGEGSGESWEKLGDGNEYDKNLLHEILKE